MKYLVFLGLLSLSVVQANIIYVNANANAGGDGTSWETAFNYLQDALDSTVSGRGDQVWIAQGTYYPDDGANVTEGDSLASFMIKDQVAVYGGFIGIETDLAQRDWEAYPTVLSGEIWEEEIFSDYWSNHVTTINDNTVSFDGITITKGLANGTGVDEFNQNDYCAAAVYGQGNITATNCIFTENSALIEGSVASGSTWTVSNCTFSGNYNSVAHGGTWTATNCTFLENTAGSGAVARDSVWTAINCTFSGNKNTVAHGGTWTAINCTFSGNSAGNTDAGSGGVARDSTWTATHCTFSGNTSRDGGVAYRGTWTVTNCIFSGNIGRHGAVANNSTWTATNCIFSGNTAISSGGVARDGTWTATNCTFSGNSAPSGSVAYGGSYGRTWKIFNNIIYNNSNSGPLFQGSVLYAKNGTTSDPFGLQAYNLIEGGSSALNATSYIPEAYILDSDPLFVDIADPDGPDDTWGTQDDGLRLQVDSPAIGFGDANFFPVDTYDLDGDDDTAESLPVDIAGYKRIQDTTLDLGAYEYGNVIGLSSVFTTTAGAATGGSVSPSGALVNTQPSEITLTATASNGYVFGYWSGDVPEELEQENPLTVTVEEDGSITAVFLQDSSDSDGDGLSQYQEVIVYGTDPADADSDADGFDDGYEVETGYNPMITSSTPDAYSEMLTAVEFRFNAANGVSYRIESSTDLENWPTVEAEIIGSSARVTRFYSIEGTQKRFYRAKRND